jgi:chaperonin cofactor prefoldin
MREFLNPDPEGKTVDASIDEIDERLELLGIELNVIREHADALKDRLDKLQQDLL